MEGILLRGLYYTAVSRWRELAAPDGVSMPIRRAEAFLRKPRSKMPSGREHRGRIMKKTFVFLAMMLAVVAQAAPPYDVTVTFTPIIGADGYNFYIDDCFAGGSLSPPVGTVTPGQTFPAVLTADGTFEMCVRAFNATGEDPDPGQVVTVVVNDLPLPGPVTDLDISIACPNGGCTVNVTVN